mmetsp:Transcript_25686/g.85729  ORF Transcript_25686/g.85729 Transcript_25686/m.85729 type:complete len:84 (+) Transcript_25686:166-417(+)
MPLAAAAAVATFGAGPAPRLLAPAAAPDGSLREPGRLQATMLQPRLWGALGPPQPPCRCCRCCRIRQQGPDMAFLKLQPRVAL